MKRQLIGLLLILSVLNGCKEKESVGNNRLNATEFAEEIAKTSEKILLDVRTPEEFNEGHIENALLINFHDDDFKQQVNKLEKTTPVYVYCASGVRSDKAAKILKDEGFEKVYVLEDGLKSWTQSNKELVR